MAGLPTSTTMAGLPKFHLALVTGASSGIGAAISCLLARRGIKVVLVARSRDKLEKVYNEIKEEGGAAVIVQCDTGAMDNILNMAEEVKKNHGVPDVIINNAATFYVQDFCDKDYRSWANMVNVNIIGYLGVIGEFVKEMRDRGSGHIVNISSDSSRVPWPGLTVYTGTKFFWAGASEALRKELSGTGVKITEVLPGFVWTEGLEALLMDEGSKAAWKKFGLGDPQELINQRDKLCQPADIAQSVWEAINKPPNIHINDVLVRDALQ